ncbi:hypothetical protein BCR43DRAFT_545501 [Syncephalastrum racemosum]|uniref:Uncharacterized protein n=1 Tax=Syncephalastrum racemosum TaxID=13706 RepID=A0A1X2HEL7_SYNRA|nr:hypothetical protein BCR43DRAFT_545501 [Syncephalastrum racemosum]
MCPEDSEDCLVWTDQWDDTRLTPIEEDDENDERTTNSVVPHEACYTWSSEEPYQTWCVSLEEEEIAEGCYTIFSEADKFSTTSEVIMLDLRQAISSYSAPQDGVEPLYDVNHGYVEYIWPKDVDQLDSFSSTAFDVIYHVTTDDTSGMSVSEAHTSPQDFLLNISPPSSAGDFVFEEADDEEDDDWEVEDHALDVSISFTSSTHQTFFVPQHVDIATP